MSRFAGETRRFQRNAFIGKRNCCAKPRNKCATVLLEPVSFSFRPRLALGRACPTHENRIALASVFALYPQMLARVLSAALNGIEAFPVEVEVNCGCGLKGAGKKHGVVR